MYSVMRQLRDKRHFLDNCYPQVVRPGGNVDFIIERNSVIPVEQTRMFTTTQDQQRYVRIQVCQGESPNFEENTKLGEILLTGLRAASRGTVTVAVTFEINTDGLLEVRALDQDTGQEQIATMRVLGGLPQEEVDAIMARSAQLQMGGGAIARR